MTYKPSPLKQIFHNTRRFLAKYWLALQPTTQIAITGSQGKTNTTRILATVLSFFAPTVVTDVNLDTIYNVPITALKVMPWTKFVIFELGIDHPGEMDLHLEIAQPKIAIVTGISPVHTDREHLGSLENLIKEKRKLIEALPENGYAILNWDDENVRNMATFTKAKVLKYGSVKDCDVWFENIKVSLDGTEFKLFVKAKIPILNDLRGAQNEQSEDEHAHGVKNAVSSFVTKIRLIGKHHAQNIMAAYLVAKIVGLPKNLFLESITSLTPLPGRMSVETGPLGTTVINDALRANPASTTSGLQTLSEIDYKKGKKIAVLAEMGELAHPEEEHKKLGKLLANLKIDYVVGIGPLQKYVVEEAIENGFAKNNIYLAKDVYEAANFLKNIIKKGDLIYLKGSLYRHVERVLQILDGKKPPRDLILVTPSQ